MATTRSTDPLIWIDCEMTGLSPTTDTILSLSCYITTPHLYPLEPTGYHCIVHHTATQLSQMSEWCISTHGRTGLTQACLSSTTTAEMAATQLLQYIKSHVPQPKVAVMAGNSIHVDRLFLLQTPWTPVVEYCHYRILDISSIKEAVRRWCTDEVIANVPRKQLGHTAEEDVRESLEEGKYYMRLFRGMSFGGRRVGRGGEKTLEEVGMDVVREI